MFRRAWVVGTYLVHTWAGIPAMIANAMPCGIAASPTVNPANPS